MRSKCLKSTKSQPKKNSDNVIGLKMEKTNKTNKNGEKNQKPIFIVM
jgi:hypothetical protein